MNNDYTKLPPTSFERMRQIATECIDMCEHKDKQYGSSWRARGGVGAFFATIRKLDRLDTQAKEKGYDVFDLNEPLDAQESFDDTLRDIVNFMLLILESREQLVKQAALALQMSRPRPTGDSLLDVWHKFEEERIAQQIDDRAIQILTNQQDTAQASTMVLKQENPKPKSDEFKFKAKPGELESGEFLGHAFRVRWVDLTSEIPLNVEKFIRGSGIYAMPQTPRVAIVSGPLLDQGMDAPALSDLAKKLLLLSSPAGVAILLQNPRQRMLGVLNQEGESAQHFIASEFVDNWAQVYMALVEDEDRDPVDS